MRIAVLVKQVPSGSDEGTDMENGFVVRTGRRRMNPYDPSALAAALELRDRFGGRVDVFSMGPAGAREVVAEALAVGADQGWLMTDKAFAGADSLSTARTLSAGLDCVGEYDLILCGEKTTDGDTGQVGASLASLRGLAFFGRVEVFEALDQGARLSLTHWADEFRQRVETILPIVCSVNRDSFTPRMPSLKMKMKKNPVQELGLADLAEPDPDRYGSLGSPTKIKKVFFPERRPRGDVREVGAAEAVELILKAVREMNNHEAK